MQKYMSSKQIPNRTIKRKGNEGRKWLWTVIMSFNFSPKDVEFNTQSFAHFIHRKIPANLYFMENLEEQE